MEKPIILNDTEVAAVAGGCSCSVFSINIFSNSFNNSHDNMLILGSSVVNSFNTDSFNTDSFNTGIFNTLWSYSMKLGRMV